MTTGPDVNGPAGAEVIDAAGLTVLPGLIDCHDHLASHGYDLATRWELDEPSSARHLRTGRVLERTLGFGYTTIRDAGGLDAGFRAAVDEGLIRGPRLLTAVAIISPIGGIGDRGEPSGHECMVLGAIRAAARAWPTASRTCAAWCARWSGPAPTSSSARPPAAPAPAPATAPRRRLRPRRDARRWSTSRTRSAAGSCATRSAGRACALALEAGVDSIEHGCYLDEDPELIPMMAERGTFLVPTLTVYEYHRESKSPHVRERAQALREHHLNTIRRAHGGRRQGRGRHRRRRPRPSAERHGDRVSRGRRPHAHAGDPGRDGLGRRVPGPGATRSARSRRDGAGISRWSTGDPLTDVRVLQSPERIRLVLKDGRVEVRPGPDAELL